MHMFSGAWENAKGTFLAMRKYITLMATAHLLSINLGKVFFLPPPPLLAHRYMRTIPNAFIASMSASDLLMASFNTTFNYVFMRDMRWDFGPAYCSVNNFLAVVTVSASVLNLTAMSADR